MKRLIFCLVMAAVLAAPLFAQAAGQPVLFVYRSESQMKAVSDVIKACGYDFFAVSGTEYHIDSLQGAAAIVTQVRPPYLDALEDGLPAVALGDGIGTVEGVQTSRLNGLHGVLRIGSVSSPILVNGQALLITAYEGGGNITEIGEIDLPLRGIYPYGILRGKEAYFSMEISTDAQALALGHAINSLTGKKSAGRLFLVIDQVYPFSDLGMLCLMADTLFRFGYAFTVSAMPVYENLTYPAFLRYAQVLRYIQSRGGAVVLHEPILEGQEGLTENMQLRWENARAALTQQGILLANGIVSPYPLTLDAFASLEGTGTAFGPLPMDVSVLLPIAKTPEELESMLQLIERKWLTVESLYRMVSDVPYVYNEAPLDAGFAYREETETSFARFFSAGNRTLLVIVILSLAAFSGLLAAGYILYRRKFFR